MPTALFDGLLALVSLGAGALCFRAGGRACELGGMGFLAVGIAATVGMVRFAGVEALAELHRALSAVAGMVGLPLVAVGFALSAWMRRPDGRPVALVSLVALGGAAIFLGGYPLYRVGIGAVAMGVVLAASVHLWRAGAEPSAARLGIVGAILALAAGALGTEGTLAGWARLDPFHVLLAISNGALGLSLVVLSPPKRP